MRISVCIATYGDAFWERLARERALPSVEGQADEIVMMHLPDGDLAQARNVTAYMSTSEYLCFLDADDELMSGFISNMKSAISSHPAPQLTLFTPMVSYVIGTKAEKPKFWPEKPLHEGNWLVIGTVVSRSLFLQVGGFESWPRAFEDWHLFGKMAKAGATPQRVPGAVYRAHWRAQSRNKNLSREERVRLHYEIGRDLWPEHYDESWLSVHLRTFSRTARPRRR